MKSVDCANTSLQTDLSHHIDDKMIQRVIGEKPLNGRKVVMILNINLGYKSLEIVFCILSYL